MAPRRSPWVFPVLSITILGIVMTGCVGITGRSAPPQSPSSPTSPTSPTPPTQPTPPPPPPTTPTDITALNHIIFMFQENRSFDHYFAHLNTYRQANGWGGPTDVDTLDNPNTVPNVPTNPADTVAPISWNSTNAASVTVNGAPENGASGGMSVSPSTATLYTAVATSASGTTAQASVVVGVTPDSGSRILAGASPMNVAPGGTAKLTWATTDGSRVNITPPPNPNHTQAYGSNAGATITLPTTPAAVTYTFTSTSGLTTSVTITVATPAPGDPTMTINAANQGHISQGAAANVASYELTDQCVEDLSPDWLESHAAYHLNDASSDVYLGNGFVHIGGGFAQFSNFQDDPHHYLDVVGTRTMGYYTDKVLPLYYFLASEFATSDQWFSPIPSNSGPNRFAELAATTAGYAHQPPSLDVPMIFQLLDTAGVSWKVYYSDVTPADGKPSTTLTNFIWGAQHDDPSHLAPVDCTRPATPCVAGQTDYFTDAKNGKLPAVALIEPGFDSGRDEHPGNAVQLGAVYDESIVQALFNSPNWKDSVFFLTYDEGGGFYDHVAPLQTVSPDGIPPKDLRPNDPPGDFTRTGFRLPLMVISPYTKPHFVSHEPADNTAILKFIETRYNLPNLTKRDAAQPPLDFFDFTKAAWATPPTLPNQPTNAPCAAYASNP